MRRKETKKSAGRIPYASPAIVVAAAVIHGLSALSGVMQYDRVAILNGEWWRALTGHLTHCSWNHLFWDVVIFAVLGCMLERENRRGFRICVIASGAAISAGMLWWLPEMRFYRGLSGIDSALFTYFMTGVLVKGIRNKDVSGLAISILALALFAGKTLFEVHTGRALFVESGGTMTPVPLAHLIGGVIGMVQGLVFTRGEKRNGR